jgi:membrane protein
VGAAFTSIAWELAKHLFAYSIGQSVRYSTIYGSLATIPIFLIWLYVTWVIVLIGLEVSFTHQNRSALVRDLGGSDSCGQARLAQTVRMFALIARRFDDGEPPPDCDELADRLQMPLFAVDELSKMLIDAGLVLPVTSSNDRSEFVPATSLDQILVSDVVRTVFRDGEPHDDDPPLDRAVDAVIADFQRAGHGAIADLSFKEFLGQIPAEGSRSEPA